MSTTTLASPTATASVPTVAPANGTFPTGATNGTTATATVLVLPQLTTPFIPPADCTPVQEWTAATISISYGEIMGNNTYSTILVPVTTGAAFSSCQPSGWDGIESEYRFSYSSAVCPSGYNYNQLSDLYSQQPNTETIRTTAVCCPSGFKYTMFFDKDVPGILGANCKKTTQLMSVANNTASAANATDSTTMTPAAALAQATMLYPPWHITWEKRDAPSLSPTPPDVFVQAPVSTWEPGTEIDPSLKRKDPDTNAVNRNLGQIIGIVAGCVAGSFAIICMVWLWFHMRSRRRRREEFMQEEHQLQEQRLRRIAEYQRSASPTADEPLPVYVESRENDKATATAMAVPPYKERSSEESSRDSRQGHEPHARNGTHDDGDGNTLHEGMARDIQNGTNRDCDGQTHGRGMPGEAR